ncbi:MAG: hypothetical protein ABI208_09155, partial [Ginsengibacter sp.]
QTAKTLRLGYMLYELDLVYKKIGFKNPSSLREWLKENDFTTVDGTPASFFRRNGYMNYSIKTIYWKPIYDSCDRITNYREEPIDGILGYIVTTLISKRGVKFLKKLINDHEMIKKISAEIRLQIEEESKF